MLALLERAGVTGPRAREALHVLIVCTIGAAAFAAGGTDDRQHADFSQGLRWLLAGIATAAPSPLRDLRQRADRHHDA